MPNLLATPANWSDGTNSPPSQWNGTAYEFLIGGEITYAGTVADGDTLDMSALVPVGTQYYSHPLIVTVNGEPQYFETAAAAYDVHITLAAGDSVYITVMNNISAYTGDVVLSLAVSPLTKRLQFEVRVANDPEGTP